MENKAEETTKTVETKVAKTNSAGKAEKSAEKRRVWVYLGPTIRGVITNGRIMCGDREEILKTFAPSVKLYPEIERLIVSYLRVAQARRELREKRGIAIAYDALLKK